MRKYSLIALIIAVVALAGIGSVLEVRYNHSVSQQKISTAQKAQKLADWNAKVKAWNVQTAAAKQLAATQAKANLADQGVASLPNTGANGMVLIAVTATSLGLIGYQYYLRRSLAHEVFNS